MSERKPEDGTKICNDAEGGGGLCFVGFQISTRRETIKNKQEGGTVDHLGTLQSSYTIHIIFHERMCRNLNAFTITNFFPHISSRQKYRSLSKLIIQVCGFWSYDIDA